MKTEAQKRACVKYNSKTYKNITGRLRYDTDKKYIEFLEDEFTPSITECLRKGIDAFIEEMNKK